MSKSKHTKRKHLHVANRLPHNMPLETAKAIVFLAHELSGNKLILTPNEAREFVSIALWLLRNLEQ